MKKYEEEHYRYENIKDSIYPWVKNELTDSQVLNGKRHSQEDTPVIPFVGDLNVIFVIKRKEDVFEVLKDNMLSPECQVEELYHSACENLVRDVEFVIGNTFYGAFVILADGHHEASSLCFKHIWQICVDKLQDDIVIMAPSKDTVLFAAASQKQVVNQMIEHGMRTYELAQDKISTRLLLFSKDRRELAVHETED